MVSSNPNHLFTPSSVRPIQPKHFKQQGFTLVELLMVLAIAGIVLAVGIVSMKANGNARAEKISITNFNLLLQNASRYARTHQSQIQVNLSNDKAVAAQNNIPIEDLEVSIPSQLSITPKQFTFDSDGTPLVKTFSYVGSYEQDSMEISLDGEVNHVQK